MAYELGAEKTFSKFSDKVGVLDTKNAYTGFRAFARNEKTGTYREVFGVSKEEGAYVDGSFQGFSFRHTHETKAEAFALANKAYRWLNK